MPKPLSPCSQPGCPNIAVKAGRCAEHPRAERNRYESTRGTSVERGYGAAWRRIRDAYLAKYPLCQWYEGCIEFATDVDHIIPRIAGGTDDETNLQALCHRHHSQKTATYDGGWGKARRW